MALPVRVRLALITGSLVASLLVAMGTFLYVRLEADLLDAVDEALIHQVSVIGNSLEADGERFPPFSAAGDELFGQLLSPDGRVVTYTGDVVEPIHPPAGDLSRSRLFFFTEVRTRQGERLPARVLAVPADEGRLLVVAGSLDDQREALHRLLILLVLGGPVAAGLAGGVGWLVARAALRPVEDMRIEAEAVSASEPGRRLPVAATGDELARLGESLNQMLARLEEAAERERRFVDDAAHELRTPLANLKAELELALRRARTPEALEASVRSAGEETDRLVRLAEDLLVLSRQEAGRLPIRREDTGVSDLVRRTAATFSARASEQGIALEVSASNDVRARLDTARVQQAVGTLIENAMRHTPVGGRITVSLTDGEEGTAIEVADTGPGFETSFLPRAFEPFSRTEDGRPRSAGGAGLGLAIVRAVAEAHGGTAEARNSPGGGASVLVRFPR